MSREGRGGCIINLYFSKHVYKHADRWDGMGWDTRIPEGVDVTLIATILKYRALESQL